MGISAFDRGMMVNPSDYCRRLNYEPYGWQGAPLKPRYRGRWPSAQWQRV